MKKIEPISIIDILEKKIIAQMQNASKKAPKTYAPLALVGLPPQIDYSPYIQYVREQGTYSCWGHALMACWDIMNEKNSPYSPNLSVNRMIWAWEFQFRGDPVPCYDGREYKYIDPYAGEKYLIDLGCPTEGSELTDTDGVRWPTEEGDYEAPNYKLAALPTPIPVDVNEFKLALIQGPIRVTINSATHVVALVGYDDATQKFKYINSYGDKWGDNGFGYIEYSKLTTEVQGADFCKFVPPKSVPSARIKFTHSYRQDVHLWIGVEGRLSAKRIWPNGQRQDNSKNLTLTVTLPRGFVWPPAPGNRLYLDIFDSGGHYETGGDMIDFTAAFCGQVFDCPQLYGGAVHFNPHERMRLYLP